MTVHTDLHINIRHHIQKVEQSTLIHRTHSAGFALFAFAVLPAVLAYADTTALLALVVPPAVLAYAGTAALMANVALPAVLAHARTAALFA